MERHHVLFHRKEHESRKDYKELRQKHGLIPKIDEEVHRELHENCPAIPTLGYQAIKHILRNYDDTSSYDKNITNLIRCIEEANDHPKAHRIQKEIGHLAMEALDLQRPYIRRGQSRFLINIGGKQWK